MRIIAGVQAAADESRDAYSAAARSCFFVDFGWLLLRFDAASQRLLTAAVNLRHAECPDVSVDAVPLFGRTLRAAFPRVYSALGATRSGALDPETHEYALCYENICVFFAVPQRFSQRFESGDEMPFELPDGSSPEATRLLLFHGPSIDAAALPPLPEGSRYMERVLVTAGASPSALFSSRGVTVRCGETTRQDLLLWFGEPFSVLRKPKSAAPHVPAREHASASASVSASGPTSVPTARADIALVAHVVGGELAVVESAVESCSAAAFRAHDLYVSYPSLGVDFGIDGASGCVSKLVLHTNELWHADFDERVKCNFEIAFPGADGRVCADDLLDGIRGRLRLSDKSHYHVSDASRGTVCERTLLHAGPGCVFEALRSGRLVSATVFAAG